MIEGIIKSPYWNLAKGETVYIDFAGKMQHEAIGIYNSKKKFVMYTWDKEMLNECVEYNSE